MSKEKVNSPFELPFLKESRPRINVNNPEKKTRPEIRDIERLVNINELKQNISLNIGDKY
jgi:hypothetical protein